LKIYVAGKWQERDLIREIMKSLRDLGHEITCDWTDHEYPTENIKEKLAKYAVIDIEAVTACDVLIFYAENNLPYAGAFCEMGAALALGKPVFIVGEGIDSCIFTNHPLVMKIGSSEVTL